MATGVSVGEVFRHEQAHADCTEEPNCRDHNESNNGRRRSYFFIPSYLSDIGKQATLDEYIPWNDPLKYLYPQEKHCEIIHEPNYWNVTRNQLNGTEEVAGGTCCYQFCVPTHARMFEHKIKNMHFFLEALRLLLPSQIEREILPDYVARRLVHNDLHTITWKRASLKNEPRADFIVICAPWASHRTSVRW
jgi:hypothetical protein